MMLYSIGCSHTGGAEIDFPEQPNCYEKAYPGLVASHFDWQYINHSQTGCGNRWIFNNSVKFVESYLINNSHNDIIVLVGWTSVPRESAIYSEKTYWLTPGSHEGKYWNSYPKPVKKWWELQMQVSGDYRQHIEELVIQMITLHGYLKSKRVRHVFVNTIHYMNRLDRDHRALIDTVPDVNFHFRNSPWYQYLKDMFPVLPDRWHHLPEAAHRHYAELLINHFQAHSEYFLT